MDAHQIQIPETKTTLNQRKSDGEILLNQRAPSVRVPTQPFAVKTRPNFAWHQQSGEQCHLAVTNRENSANEQSSPISSQSLKPPSTQFP